MDIGYITTNGPYGGGHDARPKKIRSAILDLGKKGKKTLFSAGTQHTGHLEGWLY